MIDWNSDPELAALRAEFVASFQPRKEALAPIIAALRSRGSARLRLGEPPARELRVIAHNLAGAAPTYGFESLGKVATEIDDVLSQESKDAQASDLLRDALRLEKALKEEF